MLTNGRPEGRVKHLAQLEAETWLLDAEQRDILAWLDNMLM